jgi:hypothetical protein
MILHVLPENSPPYLGEGEVWELDFCAAWSYNGGMTIASRCSCIQGQATAKTLRGERSQRNDRNPLRRPAWLRSREARALPRLLLSHPTRSTPYHDPTALAPKCIVLAKQNPCKQPWCRLGRRRLHGAPPPTPPDVLVLPIWQFPLRLVVTRCVSAGEGSFAAQRRGRLPPLERGRPDCASLPVAGRTSSVQGPSALPLLHTHRVPSSAPCRS